MRAFAFPPPPPVPEAESLRAEVRAFLDAETKKWAEVIRVSGAKAD